jgi:hypothetical protein
MQGSEIGGYVTPWRKGPLKLLSLLVVSTSPPPFPPFLGELRTDMPVRVVFRPLCIPGVAGEVTAPMFAPA